MFKSLFQALFGSFSRKQQANEQREQERQLIARMIVDARAIADGSYIFDEKLPKPMIPERRKEQRNN